MECRSCPAAALHTKGRRLSNLGVAVSGDLLDHESLPLNELAAPVPRQLSKTLGGGSKMSIETKTLLLSHQGFGVNDGGHLALEVDGAN